MKNKSKRHKESNTFKFQPFSERLANVNIDIFHRVGHEYETQLEENECLFYQAIDKWDVLNLTDAYNAFRKEVDANNLITLPQLIHRKDHVAQVLLKHLQYKNSHCLQALLELVVALANDLRKDFYPYYPEFLNIIIDLLNTKDTDLLEWTFMCLAYLFKFLWRPLVKDVGTVFKSLLPLLSDSKPDYINNFAAESFAFVVRKVKDREGFLNFILKTVENSQDGVAGCGKLLFEVVNGIGGQFHSCADAMLPFLLQSLANDKLPQNILFEILEEVVINIVANIQATKMDLFWMSAISILESYVQEWSASPTTQLATNIELILKLVGQALEHHSGKLLQNPVPLVQTILKLLILKDLPETVWLVLSQVSILLLLSNHIRLPQEHASALTTKNLCAPKEVLLHFVDHIAEYSSFEALVLPTFLKHCFENDLESHSLHVLTKIVLTKSPLCQIDAKLATWTKYPIDFNSKQRNAVMRNILLEYIRVEPSALEDIDKCFCALICLPHFNTDDCLADIKYKLKSIISVLCKEVGRRRENGYDLRPILFLLLNALQCALHIAPTDCVIDNVEIINVILPLTPDVKHLSSLKILCLCLSAMESEQLNMSVLKTLHRTLQANFSSPYHELRLYTARIYTFFEHAPELQHSTISEKWNVFTICYHVESTVPQVQTYRDQLQHLERLSFDKPQTNMCQNTDFKEIPLRYLCGVLYMNFRLLWEPTIQIIATHAHGVGFWSIFLEELRLVVRSIREPPEVEQPSLNSGCVFLENLFKEAYQVDVKPDFVNYRLLLWKAMALFPEVAEAKTRDTSELLLEFIRDEYMKSDVEIAAVWNIKENSKEEAVIDIDDAQNDEENTSRTELLKSAPQLKRKSNLQSLQSHLTVFSKIRSPKSMYREPELQKLYFDLLSHKNHEIQKLALDCIMTYNYKHLTPYREHLYNLIDEKNFKNELATFRVDQESSIVQVEHRDQLIPVVLKLVYSKMFAKTGLRTGGKSSSQLRRNLVLRFLAGCRENELVDFITMAFRFYIDYFQDDLEGMVEALWQDVDLQRFVPPKRLQSTLNLLTIVLEHFGSFMRNDLLAVVLKVIFVVGAMIKSAFDRLNEVHKGYLTILKNLRASCIRVVERFFGRFESYPWTCQEIQVVFMVFVWPYLDKLSVEGIHSPTALLKLFLQWGSNPRYFELLVVHEPNNREQYVLPHIVGLLLNKQSHGSVVAAIMEMCEALLSLVPDDVDLKMGAKHLLPIQDNILERLKINQKLNYGSCILLPQAPSILELIKRKLESKSKHINQRELFVLSRISELIWEADISDQVLRLLLPVIAKRAGSGEETVLKFVTTLSHLLQNVTEPQNHFKLMLPLFGEITYVSCRATLCEILKTVSKKFDEPRINLVANLVVELNAWDEKWVDQPDFQRRLDGFKHVQSLVESGSLELEVGVAVIYNCYHTIHSETDLSLRENAAHCWKNTSAALIRKYETAPKDIDYILNDILFTTIRKGFKSKKDDVRNECILLLGHLARECPNAHVVLGDLNKLTNKADVEVDFFENLTHLQLHRRTRALVKFSQIFRQLENTPSSRTLTQFVLPLASQYLCTERYAQKNSLVDAAIEVVGTVSKLLPWHQYEGVLKFYLTKLQHKVEFQRQLVRLTVAVLDAFHFDLSKAHVELVKVRAGNEKQNSEPTTVADTDDDKNLAGNVGGEDEKEEIAVDEILEQLAAGDDDEEEPNKAVVQVKAVDKVRVLSQSTATKVIRTIQVVLLPRLHKALAQLTQHESSHKVNRKRTGAEREEEELLKVPISLAVVKLLQRLPKEILEHNLPGVLMKLCTFLKSPLESVRRVTRETLQKIMLTLGPQYLNLLLGEMTPLLPRGFQVHVLVYTVHAVLVCLKEHYQPKHIDDVLLMVLKLCKADLFGSVAEEKEVEKIGRKVSEAKSTKSFDTLQILATYITDKCLMDIVLPIRDVLTSSRSYKIVHKAQEALRHIAIGLVENEFLPIESLLKFAYGISSESIPELLPANLRAAMPKKKATEKVDCFIISAAPVGRSGVRSSNVKSSQKTNAHILVEFGLRLCHHLLKKEKVKDDEHKPFVDPFVVIFKNCLSSRHVKLSTFTLQCLSYLMKYDLPSMKENIAEIAELMFAILHKYAASGLSKGDNFELVVAAFKAMSVLVRDVKFHNIEGDQLKILLLYVEQDLHNCDRQATAFALLRAIISRKLITPEIHPVMEKVAELSITSEQSHVRLQARQVFHQFLMDYPLKNKVGKHVAFYLSQLDYEVQTGRESAIHMIQSLIHSFPIKVLVEHSGTFLIRLGARLINDDVAELRKMIADCLTAMFKRLPRPDCDPLFDVMLLWLKEQKRSHQQLAAQLCGLLVTVEKSSFETRLPTLMPVILKQFEGEEHRPGRYVLLKHHANNDEEDSANSRIKDHHLFQVLQMLLKICAQCPSFLNRAEDMQTLSEHVQTLLGHPHDWVRLAAAQFLGFVLSSLDIDKLATLLASHTNEESGYLYTNPSSDVKALTLDLCAQLQPKSIKSDLAEQVIKNLVFVARVLEKVPLKSTAGNESINLLWLTKQMRKVVNMEVIKTPSEIILRMEVFKWIAGVGTVLELEKVIAILHHLLAPLVREMITTEESNAPLRQLSKEVGNMLKKRIGVELYTNTLSRVQQHLAVKRTERKRERNQLAVTDPEMYAKKRIKANEKKKEAKKRKIVQMKGTVRKAKRRKMVDLDDNSEVM